MPKTSRAQFNLQPIYAIQHHERLLLIFLRATNYVVKNIRQLFLPLDALDVKIVKAIRQHIGPEEGQNHRISTLDLETLLAALAFVFETLSYVPLSGERNTERWEARSYL